MEFLNIIGSISIKPDWANISGAVLKAGTPLSITGVVANNANAIGLLADEAHKGDGEVNVVYAGLVDINEVEASYGDSLADDCVAALKGITFVSASGAATISSGLPDYSEASNGDVLSIDNGAPAWKAASGGGIPYSPIEYDETTETYTLSEIRSPLYITALEPTSPESADISIEGLAIEGATAVSPILGSVTMRIDGETGGASYEASMVGTVDIELAGDSILVQISEGLQDGICNAVLNKIANSWNGHGRATAPSLLRVWFESAPVGDIYPTMVFPPLAL